MRVWWLGLLPACHTVYAPNMPSAPLLSQRGELRASLDPRNLQAAYAVTDDIGLVANGYYRRGTAEHDAGPDERGRGWLVEVGAGAGRALSPWLRGELYAGGGFGGVAFDQDAGQDTPARHFAADAFRAFVMPTLGLSRDYVDLAVSARLVWLDYSNVERREYDDFDGLDEPTWFFLEPCLTVRVGYRWIKLQAQLGRSIQLGGAAIDADPGLVTLGLHADLFRAWE